MSGIAPGVVTPGFTPAVIIVRSLTPLASPVLPSNLASFTGLSGISGGIAALAGFSGASAAGQWTAPTVWIEEQHRDSLVITEHPVEQGAPISDHAYNRPAEVTIRVGWNGESPSDIQAIYQQIITLKVTRTLFDLQTGKRAYINMLAGDVAVATDQRTEFVLFATIRCRQVILVNTQTLNVSSDTLNQAVPSSTAAQTNSGQTNLTPGPNFNPVGLTPSNQGAQPGGP